MLSSGGEGETKTQIYLIISDKTFLLIDEVKKHFARLLRPVVARHWTNVHQVAPLRRPHHPQMLAFDWTQALGAQPLFEAIVGQMHLQYITSELFGVV